MKQREIKLGKEKRQAKLVGTEIEVRDIAALLLL